MKAYTRNHNHNEFNTIIALNSVELKNFAYSEEQEILTIKEIQKKEKEEEYIKHAKELNDLLKKAKNIVSSKGENLTIEDIAIISDLLDTYSDMYKDLYDVRPRCFSDDLWCEIETVAPKTMARFYEMEQKGIWWDFVLSV